MDMVFAFLALCLLAVFAAAVLLVGWMTGVWGGVAFVALTGGVCAWAAQGHHWRRHPNDPRFNAFQQPLSKRR